MHTRETSSVIIVSFISDDDSDVTPRDEIMYSVPFFELTHERNPQAGLVVR